MDYPEQSFKIAAKWWADNVYRKQAKLDNGDAQTEMFLGMTRAPHPILEEKVIQGFEAALVEEVKKEWGPGQTQTLWIGVDYHPCTVLKRAAIEAGTPHDRCVFPVKTSMWIKENGVSVKYGYTAEVEDLALPV